MPTGAIYLYFESKEEIFRALSAQLLERTIEAARRAACSPAPIGERILGVLLSELLVAPAERAELRPDQAGWQPRELAELLVDAARGLQGEGASRPTGAAYRRRLGVLVAPIRTALGAPAPVAKRSRLPGATRPRTRNSSTAKGSSSSAR